MRVTLADEDTRKDEDARAAQNKLRRLVHNALRGRAQNKLLRVSRMKDLTAASPKREH